MGRYYGQEPHWIEAQCRSECKRCKGVIQRGDAAFYYPKGRALYCGDDACGQQEDREFHAAAADEDFYSRGY